MRLTSACKKKLIPELEELINIICEIDSFRVGRGKSPEKLYERIKRVKLKSISWKRTIQILKDIENYPTKNPVMVFVINLALLLRVIPWIILFTVIISYWAGLARFIGFQTYKWASLAMLVFGGIALIISYLLRSYIKGFFEKSIVIKNKSARLKAFNQELINKLCEHIREKNENPQDYKLSLFNIDYDNIDIVKKPSFVREYYIVVPSMRQAENASRRNQKLQRKHKF